MTMRRRVQQVEAIAILEEADRRGGGPKGHPTKGSAPS